MTRTRQRTESRTRTTANGFSGVGISSGTDVIGPGVQHIAITPTGYTPNSKTGIILAHGMGSTASQWVNDPYLSAMTFGLVRAGFPCLAVTWGDTWGNDASIARTTLAQTYLQGTMGAKAGAIGFLGASMGYVTSSNWARANLASTAFLMGLVPGIDIPSIYTAPGSVVFSIPQAIDAAYPAAYVEATDGPTHNPANYVATMVGVKSKLWYGTTDQIVLQATVTTYQAAHGANCTIVPIVGGHITTIQQIPPADVVAYAVANQT